MKASLDIRLLACEPGPDLERARTRTAKARDVYYAAINDQIKAEIEAVEAHRTYLTRRYLDAGDFGSAVFK